MKKLFSLTLVLAMLSALVACGGSAGGNGDAPATQEGAAAPQAAEEYVLLYNHANTESEPYHEAFLGWAEAVAERTGGGLTIEVYANSQLGVEEDIVEQIRGGANIGQHTDSARLGNYVNDIAVLNAPYFLDSLEDINRLADLDCVQEWLQELEDEYDIKVLALNYVQGFRNIVANKPVTSPAEVGGMLLRTPGAPIWQESTKALGATPVALARSEIYSAVQTKVVDGIEDLYTSIEGGKLNEVLDTVSETRHILLINTAIVSAQWFNSLPEEYQQILEEECQKAGAAVSQQLVGPLAEECRQRLVDEGMTIIPYEDMDIEAFRLAAEDAYTALDLADARERVYAELGK